MCWNPEYAILLFISTLITWLSGLLLEKMSQITNERKKQILRKACVLVSFVSNLGILFFFKYYHYAESILSKISAVTGMGIQIPAIDVILPVGISFYTFQALSYTMDVYRGEIYAEKNILKYALFVSFFPQLVAGPIERSKNLLKQISTKHEFQVDAVRSGLLLMLYGFFQKVVVSEYLSVVVDNVYNTYIERSGFQLLVATVFFAFQIYCDFAGYSNIAIGAAQVMGFQLMENFNAPYLSQSVAEFWRRWHISLSTWFRDYLYIPLGGSRKGIVRKQINRLIVFGVSGLWHGASGHFVIWGLMNGVYQIIGDLLTPLRKKTKQIFHVKENEFSHKVLKTLSTFALIDLSWIFFRATMGQGVAILKSITQFWKPGWFQWGVNLNVMQLSDGRIWIVLFALMILIGADICKYVGFQVSTFIMKQGIWLRWMIYLAAIFGVLIYGIYGPAYSASEFIYFQF